MQATDQKFIGFIGATERRYVIPIFQRRYTWEIKHCEQLLKDMLAVAESSLPCHFTGSVVWVREDDPVKGPSRMLLIDGQQRTTTLMLILIALARFADTHEGRANSGESLNFSKDLILNTLLIHPFESGDNRFRLTLSQEDKLIMNSLIQNLEDPTTPKISDEDSRILKNFEWIKFMVDNLPNQNDLWAGFRKLQIVSVMLDQYRDNPQLVFESMNSTGKSLSNSDLIRNYVLMDQSLDEQERLFANYWLPIENLVNSNRQDDAFEDFIVCYIPQVYETSAPITSDIYPAFKQQNISRNLPRENLLAEMLHYATLYKDIAFPSSDNNDALAIRYRRLNSLGYMPVRVLSLAMLHANSQGRMTCRDLIEGLDLIECFIVRRAITSYDARAYRRLFFDATQEFNKNLQDDKANSTYLLAGLKEFFYRKTAKSQILPDDEFVKNYLRTRGVYINPQMLRYILGRIENSLHEKHYIDFEKGTWSIEHVMPQSALEVPQWRADLGDDAEEIFSAWIDNIGNLTLTVYNTELSNKPFLEKKVMFVGGYEHDGLAISSLIRQAECWNVKAMEKRRNEMIDLFLKVFPNLASR